MKSAIAVIVGFVAVMAFLLYIMSWSDDRCLQQDAIDIRTLHPDWTPEQIDAQARVVHKSHMYRGGGGSGSY